jgi:HK97 gp10 family phage protein
MDNVTIKTEGFAEFEQQLLAMAEGYRSDLVARNTLTKAVKVAMEPVLQTAINLAHYGENNYSGIHMRDTLKLEARIPNQSDNRSAFVKDSDAVIGIVSVKRSAVSLANEFGTAKMAARPFLIPALERNLTVILSKLKSELSWLIPAYAAKLNRKRK